MTSHSFTVYRGAPDGSISETVTSLTDRPLVNDEGCMFVSHTLVFVGQIFIFFPLGLL
jgi:hypothetical protein